MELSKCLTFLGRGVFWLALFKAASLRTTDLSLLCLAVLLASAFGSPMTQGPCRAEMSHVRLTAALHMMDAI